MIKIQNLSYTYPEGTKALKNINVEFPLEHIYAIMGQSGSGKTTLLNCIARFLKPQSGKILLQDQNILEMNNTEFRAKVGVVFQHLNLFPHLNILQNMTLAPKRTQKRSGKTVQAEAREMLERLDIADLAESYPNQISGGQAQRAAIARGLMLHPEIMLLDEPTSALDARTTSEFAQWLRELQAETCFIIVTHDLPFAKEAAQKGMYMENGKVLNNGVIGEILSTIRE